MLATNFSTTGPDIVDVSKGKGSCILDKARYRTAGLDSYSQCSAADSTASTLTYTLPEAVESREITASEKGEAVYFGVCAGCHAYSARMIGPPTMTLQAIYQNNPQGIADYMANPKKHRDDYPEMPPQNYLSVDVRKAVAEYLLRIEK